MPFNSIPVKLTYSDERLSILVEEYLPRQKKSFTFEGICAYVLYWAMEEGMITTEAEASASAHVSADAESKVRNGITLFETNELQQGDKDRICRILDKIVKDGRIVKVTTDESRYVKQL